MKYIMVHLEIDEDTILKESGQETLDDAISQELNWLRNSGMFVARWSYSEPGKEISVPSNLQNVKTLTCVETDRGLEELTHGFKSEHNFLEHPDRICYVPDLWDFEHDGPGITGQEILDLCDGDHLKAEMVFSLCDWQHPSTILSEWTEEDEVALDAKRAEQDQQHTKQTPFTELLDAANLRASGNQPIMKDIDRNRK